MFILTFVISELTRRGIVKYYFDNTSLLLTIDLYYYKLL